MDKFISTISIVLVLVVAISCKKKDVDCNFVDNAPDVIEVSMFDKQTACYYAGSSIHLDATRGSATAYLWASGGDTSSSIVVTVPGVYSVTVFRPSDTTTYDKEVALCDGLYAPNTISANGDGNNDEFILVGSGVGCFFIEIRDAEGTLVFTSSDINISWKGKLNNEGHTLPQGVFTYYIEYIDEEGGEKNVVTGRVALIR